MDRHVDITTRIIQVNINKAVAAAAAAVVVLVINIIVGGIHVCKAAGHNKVKPEKFNCFVCISMNW